MELALNEVVASPSREQQLYWQEFVSLKVDACYVRDYRNQVGRWVSAAATVRAIASSASIGAWVIWKQYAYIWASLIALSQVMDALKDVFPLYKRRRALSRWSRTLDRLFIETQRNWDDIYSGKCTDAQIRRMLHQIRTRKQRAEERYIPDGLLKKNFLFEKAQDEAKVFFSATYNLPEE